MNSQGTQYPMTPSTEATVTPVALTPTSSGIDSVATNPLGQEKIGNRLEPNQPATTTNASENETGEQLAVEANEAEVSTNDQKITENEIMVQMNEREMETTFTVDTNDLIPMLEIFTMVRERFHAKAISTSASTDRSTARCEGKHRAKCLRGMARRFRDETPRGQCK